MISTSRFVLYWVAVSLPLPLAKRLLFAPAPLTSSKDHLLDLGLSGLALVGSAWLQGRLLARCRRPVKYWTAAALVGWVIVSFAQFSLALQALRSGGSFQGDVQMWAYLVISTSTNALGYAAPKAAALWGFRRPDRWILWLSAHLVLGLGFLAAGRAAQALMQRSATEQTLLSFLLVTAAAALTAWLLDLLAFPRTEEPYLAGSSSSRS